VTEFVNLYDWIQTVTLEDLPPVPFEFGGPWCVVVNAERFLKWMQSQGPDSVRARNYGALQNDLRTLKEMLDGATAVPSPSKGRD
jgi:hypothetical protein